MTFLGKPTQTSGSLVWDGGKFTSSVITGTGTTTGSLLSFGIADYTTTTSTSSNPDTIGQIDFDPTEYSGPTTLKAVLAATSASVTSSIKLLNLDDVAFVEIGGSGVDTLSTASTDPAVVTSVDLNNAANFNSTSGSKYELQLFTSDGSTSVSAGGASFVVTGTLVDNSGDSDWIDGGGKLRTTSSVAISGETEFAGDRGADVYFFVSGTLSSGSAGDAVSVFGGDVRVSGTLAVGTGSAFIDDTKLSFGQARIEDDAGTLRLFDKDNASGKTLNSITSSAPTTRITLGSYATSTATSSNPEAVGGGYFAPSEHYTGSCIFRAVVATETGSNTAFVQLFNINSGSLVEIGGSGVTEISSSSPTPSSIESVELLTATNFNPSTASVYEVRTYGSGSSSPVTTFMNSEIVCS